MYTSAFWTGNLWTGSCTLFSSYQQWLHQFVYFTVLLSWPFLYGYGLLKSHSFHSYVPITSICVCLDLFSNLVPPFCISGLCPQYAVHSLVLSMLFSLVFHTCTCIIEESLLIYIFNIYWNKQSRHTLHLSVVLLTFHYSYSMLHLHLISRPWYSWKL